MSSDPVDGPSRRGRSPRSRPPLVLAEQSALVALALSADKEHVSAVRASRQLAADEAHVIVTSEALCDAHAAIAALVGPRTAARWLAGLHRSGIGLICPGPAELESGRKLLAAAGDARYSLANSVGLATARRVGAARVWTYDRVSAWVATGFGFTIVE